MRSAVDGLGGERHIIRVCHGAANLSGFAREESAPQRQAPAICMPLLCPSLVSLFGPTKTGGIPMKMKFAVSAAALMMSLTACNTLRPWTQEPEAGTEASLAAVAPVNRFKDFSVAEADLSRPAYADPSLDGLRSASLSRFNSEAEFLDWLKAVREAAKARGVHSWRDYPTALPMPTVAMPSGAMESAAQGSPPPPPPPPPSAEIGRAHV
jgi:hypothetical protein